MNETVITYQSPNGEIIDLTQSQIDKLRKQGVWPRDQHGAEYCTVSHGLHETCQTIISDTDLIGISR
jgi:hypothetical protein